jgi:hypothetical protein
MTDCNDDCGGGLKKEVVSDLTITIEADDNKGDYIKLSSDESLPPVAVVEECSPPSRRSTMWYWVKMVLLFLFLGFSAVAVIKWIGPYLIDKVCYLCLFFFFLKWLFLYLGFVFPL